MSTKRQTIQAKRRKQFDAWLNREFKMCANMSYEDRLIGILGFAIYVQNYAHPHPPQYYVDSTDGMLPTAAIEKMKAYLEVIHGAQGITGLFQRRIEYLEGLAK